MNATIVVTTTTATTRGLVVKVLVVFIVLSGIVCILVRIQFAVIYPKEDPRRWCLLVGS